MTAPDTNRESGPDLRPTRVADEWLLHARRNPTKLAAWVLRSVIDELIDRRLTDTTFGEKGSNRG